MGKERVSDDDKSRRLRRKKCAPSGAIDNIIGSQLLQNETTKYNCRHRNNKKVRFTTLTLQPCYFIRFFSFHRNSLLRIQHYLVFRQIQNSITKL